jgi:recombinational DNA repair ATPase RecF
VAIVADEPVERRRWLDRAAFTARPMHLDVVRAYRRALDQKGAALRTGGEPAVLDVLDEQIARLGGELAERREALLAELQPHVSTAHERIVEGAGHLALRYRTESCSRSSSGSS